MCRITANDIEEAIVWLQQNEDEDGCCARVARWLRKEQLRRIYGTVRAIPHKELAEWGLNT